MKRLLVPALLLAFAVPSFAREVVLGTTKLSHGGDVDTLVIRSCANGPDRNPGRDPRGDEWDRDGRRRNRDGRLQAFRFVVTKARADVNRVDVTYGNGRRESFYPRDRNFVRNESSNWFDLGGRERCIRALTVWGETDTRGVRSLFKKARVTFIGLE